MRCPPPPQSAAVKGVGCAGAVGRTAASTSHGAGSREDGYAALARRGWKPSLHLTAVTATVLPHLPYCVAVEGEGKNTELHILSWLGSRPHPTVPW